MDKDAIKAAVLKQRTFRHEIEGRGFTIVLPTDHQLQVAYIRAGATQDLAVWSETTRKLLETAIIGWSGVIVSDFLRNDDADEQAFHAELAPLLLDAQPDWTKELTVELNTRLAMRREEIDGAKKNLATTSSG